MKQPCVYFVVSKTHGTIYIGVTSYLQRRIYEHRKGLIEGFSKRYGCRYLAYYEMHETMEHAIAREKALKGSSRKRKIALIEKDNPDWLDLYENLN